MTSELFDLTGRTALVTGAGQGVGREIARTLARQGARVAVNDFFAERAEDVVREIEAEGGHAAGFAVSVADYEGVQAMAAKVEAALGPVDILVNNAGNAGPDGAMPRLDFWETEPAGWQTYFDVNLYGVMNCARAFTPGMVARKYGRVITIVSDAGRMGEQGYEAYSAAKAAAAGFSRALARSTGRFGITVNNIALSNIRREDTPSTPEGDAMIKEMLKRYIVRRQGAPSDVAPVVLLLASEQASWITGQTYPVNGGFALSI